ncbi:hypothetical protein D3C87_324740 [compost metagenome]
MLIDINSRGIVHGRQDARHLYELNVEWVHPIHGLQKMKIEVHANNRSQAARIAKDCGYTVRDMNMVG